MKNQLDEAFEGIEANYSSFFKKYWDKKACLVAFAFSRKKEYVYVKNDDEYENWMILC